MTVWLVILGLLVLYLLLAGVVILLCVAAAEGDRQTRRRPSGRDDW